MKAWDPRVPERFAVVMEPDIYLAPHFTARELACRHCGRVYVTPVLLEMLERFRELVGGPVTISSGYRCPEHNAEMNGTASMSAHMFGMAADILVPGHLINPVSFLEHAESVARKVRGGFHYYLTQRFFHFDCKPYPPDRRW